MATASRSCRRASRSSATSRERALRGDRPTRARRFYGLMFHPEVVHTPDGAQAARQLRRARSAGLPGDWTMAAFAHEAIARHPRAGRQRPGDLRPLRRRRFRGRGGADPRGDRRPAHLRLRRPRPDAAGRGRAGRRRCSATTTTSRWSMWTPRTLFLAALDGVTDPEAKRKTIGRLFIDVFEAEAKKTRRRRFPRPGHALSGRDRERLASPAARRSPSRATTMSAACPSA